MMLPMQSEMIALIHAAELRREAEMARCGS
jgi:hypothetical protein